MKAASGPATMKAVGPAVDRDVAVGGGAGAVIMMIPANTFEWLVG